MWRRSWLSREVLLFGLFFSALSLAHRRVLALACCICSQSSAALLAAFTLVTPTLGIAGMLASAYIYLVPARPAWNTVHTPVDFLLSSAVLGSAQRPLLIRVTAAFAASPQLGALALADFSHAFPLWPLVLSSALWMLNHIVRTVRLHRSALYERQATASLLNTQNLRGTFLVGFAFIGLAMLLSLIGLPSLALPAAFAAVISARYLFFVSVVPLNMALTFVRSVHA